MENKIKSEGLKGDRRLNKVKCQNLRRDKGENLIMCIIGLECKI